MTPEETIQHLNELIETCKNGELGYHTAAEHVRNSQLETIFTDYSRQRGDFARQLQAEVSRLGGAPANSGTVAAALHRGWIDLKSGLSGGDGAAIVAACETGEDSAAAAFERVADTGITGQTKLLVEKQWRKIQEAHLHLLRLKEGNAAADFPKND